MRAIVRELVDFGECWPTNGDDTDTALVWVPAADPLGETTVTDEDEPRFDNEGRNKISPPPPEETVFRRGTGDAAQEFRFLSKSH